ncbi:MAG: hypothetical protein R3D29_04750 [Nitratireductor sp.]
MQIGHNVVIGRHCVIVGLAGVAGSATLETMLWSRVKPALLAISSAGDAPRRSWWWFRCEHEPCTRI